MTNLRTKIEEVIRYETANMSFFNGGELADQICTIFKEELEKKRKIGIAPEKHYKEFVYIYEGFEAGKREVIDSLINSLEERKTVREICPATKKPVEECLCSSCSQYRERRNKLLGD